MPRPMWVLTFSSVSILPQGVGVYQWSLLAFKGHSIVGLGD
jgi:hypothetical protein